MNRQFRAATNATSPGSTKVTGAEMKNLLASASAMAPAESVANATVSLANRMAVDGVETTASKNAVRTFLAQNGRAASTSLIDAAGDDLDNGDIDYMIETSVDAGDVREIALRSLPLQTSKDVFATVKRFKNEEKNAESRDFQLFEVYVGAGDNTVAGYLLRLSSAGEPDYQRMLEVHLAPNGHVVSEHERV